MLIQPKPPVLEQEVTDVETTQLELSLAPGMGVFTSQGHFEPDTGQWQLGDLRPDERATLLLPAMPAQFTEPACYENEARIPGTSISDSARPIMPLSGVRNS